MAVVTKAFFSWAGNELSKFIRDIDTPFELEEQDSTGMTDEARDVELGLQVWMVTITFKDPDVVDGPLARLWGDFVARTTRAIEYRGSTDAVSATNAKYTGMAVVKKCPPLSQGVGDLRTVQVAFKAKGKLTRSIMP